MLQVQDQAIFEITKPLKEPGTMKYCSTETNIQILYLLHRTCKSVAIDHSVIVVKQVKDCQFRKWNTLTVNLQKFVQLYRAFSTPMKQRNFVLDRVRVQYRLFRSSRKRQ